MTEDEAFDLIRQALEKTGAGLGARAQAGSHLIEDGILDSLDSMNFLFELEQLRGKRFDEIDETFNDFRVSRLIEIVRAS